eukprot:c6556_g1_i1.p1 GENE.c6556_g1_i1~~c6556_g1_i1.p1  ORF type:complete len:324 (-),score=45.39 c6556_g1_i1:4-975(-)
MRKSTNWSRLPTNDVDEEPHQSNHLSHSIALHTPSDDSCQYALASVSRALLLFAEQLAMIEVEVKGRAVTGARTHVLTHMLEEASASAHSISNELVETRNRIGATAELLQMERDFKDSLQKLRGLIRFCMVASPKLEPSAMQHYTQHHQHRAYGTISSYSSSDQSTEGEEGESFQQNSNFGSKRSCLLDDTSYQMDITEMIRKEQAESPPKQRLAPSVREITDETYERQRLSQIAEVEKDVRELSALFRDIATMVDAQQEHIDTLEDNIENAAESVQSGTRSLSEASKGQQKLRNRRICIVSFFLVAAMTIALAFYLPSRFSQ